MRFLTWTEKQLVQTMIIETLERAFDKDMAQEIYRTYSEAVFREIENSEWFLDGKDIMIEYINPILGGLMNDCAKFMFEGEFENEP